MRLNIFRTNHSISLILRMHILCVFWTNLSLAMIGYFFLLTTESFGLIAGEDEIEVVISAARAVADPKGFLSMKDVTKLLLPEQKEERWDRLRVFSNTCSSTLHPCQWVTRLVVVSNYRSFEACKRVIVAVSGGSWTSFLT